MDTNTEKKSRYSVSRKGMGGAPVKYTLETLQEILDLKAQGVSVLKTCKDRNLPYVSVNSAMKRLGLKAVKLTKVVPAEVVVAPAGTQTQE
jgi:hypothetical protein